MKSYEKEVLQAQLDNEKAVLKKLEANYTDALDEINDRIAMLLGRQDSDLQHVVYQVEFQKNLKTQIQSILEQLQNNEFESVSEYLTRSYEEGFIGAMYSMQKQGVPLILPLDQEQVVNAIQNETKLSESLYTSLGKDIKQLNKQIASEISRGISNATMYSEIARNISGYARIPKNNAMRIVRTESHRIQNKAAMDACVKAKSKGADVLRQWDASLDGRTRKSHRKLDGQIRELDEPFEVNGHKAMFPGDFGRPEEDINCRCAVLQRARWALGNDYTKWSEEAEIEYSDDGTAQLAIIEADNYKDFQKKYKQASERVREGAQMINDEDTLEKTGKSSIIKSKWDNDLQPRGQAPHIDEDDLYSYVSDELGITEDEAIEYTDAVMGFTDELYSDIRRYQRKEAVMLVDEETAKVLSDKVEEYIQAAPRWNGGATYRGVTISDEELSMYKEGYIIDGMGGTTSWSAKEDQAAGFATRTVTYERPNSIIYHCETQSKGTGIRHLAVFEHEEEVLCSKESKYKVLKTETDADNIVHIFLEEVIE